MKISIGTVLAALCLLSMVGPTTLQVVHADDRYRGDDHGRERMRIEEERRHEEERRMEEMRLHQAPIYAPAPVVYVPPPSPGITLVLPIAFH